MTGSGALDHRATFAVRIAIKDDMGGTQGNWETQFEVWASVRYLRGTEAVMEARLASRNPVVVTVRNNTDTRRITSEWQVTLRDRTGITKEYRIKEDPRPIERGAVLEMLAEG